MNSNDKMAETRCLKCQSVQNLHRSFDRFDIVESDTTTDCRFQLYSDSYNQITCFHRYRVDAIFYGLRFAKLLGSWAVIV